MVQVARSPEPVWGVVIAASAGGIPALRDVLRALPGDLPAAVLVVQHLAPSPHSGLAEILARGSAFVITEAHAGVSVAAGHAYVAPPDRHLLVSRTGIIELSDEPPVHFLRPAADVTFPSVADYFGRHTVAVVLTGSGSDGAVGSLTIHKAGGIVIAQDEATAQHTGMPHAVVQFGHADYVLPLDRIAGQISNLIMPQ